ncbi:MAG: FtsX-like permease family protein [Cyclobacteriaceae bacterium]
MSQFTKPPQLPLKLLRLYCGEHRLEEIEGDLTEVFNEFVKEHGTRFSTFFFWWLVIRGFRSYALKRKTMKNKGLISNAIMFLRHNLTITWRNLVKYKTTSVINILGLAIGISSFLAIYTIIQFELSFNKEIPDGERIYRITSAYSGAFTATNRGVAVPIPGHVKEQFTGLEGIAHFFTFNATSEVMVDGLMKDMGRQSEIAVADKEYFKVINQYEWLAGSEEELDDPFKVVLTEKQARTYFGNIDWQDMIGRKIAYRDSLEVYVSGIVKEPDYNTDFVFTEFISFPTISSSWLKERFENEDWGSTNSSTQLFVKQHPGTTKTNLLSQLEGLNEFVGEKNKELDWVQNYNLQPLSDLHYNPDMGIFDNSRSSAHRPTLIVLGVVAVFLLLIAVFNFVNLETAQSVNKSKEVGVRKVMGSSRSNLVGRFLTESILITFFAVLISIPVAHYGLALFQEFIPEGAALQYESAGFWIFIILLIFSVGIVAGFYPSWVTSSYQPSRALKSGSVNKSSNMRGSLIRKVLISFQFLFSQLLIVGTLAVVFQISYMLDKELGFDEEGVFYFYTPWYDSEEKRERLVNQIVTIPEIRETLLNGSPPVQNGYSTSTIKFMNGDDELVLNPHQKSGDTSYLSFYNLKLLAGENLKPNESANELLINETFMRDLGFELPREIIGKQVDYNDDNYTIAGVMEDFHFRSMHHPIEPMFIRYGSSNSSIAMKVGSDDQLQSAIDKLTEEWHQVYENVPLTIYFMDETVEKFYETERKTSKLASMATGMAIFISCLGLFGLISFTIVQKSKELGIRKVLGASLFQIGSILSREFFILILISFAIATPVAWYLIGQWQTDFAYHKEISWWVYGLGGFASMLIAMLTIGVRVWKASRTNPIESLRYE